jgi:hypothetical protein
LRRHSRALFKQHGVAPTASLCLPMEDNAALHPERAERFLMPALEVAHALGCNILGGVTYSDRSIWPSRMTSIIPVAMTPSNAAIFNCRSR